MSAVWDSVRLAAEDINPRASARIANLSVAAAARHVGKRGRKPAWGGTQLREVIRELALSPLPVVNEDSARWQRLAGLAMDAAHLGHSPAGMHSWAAAYQRATTTQKALGAYATHNAFASALARITIGPIGTTRIPRIVDPSVGAGNLLLAAVELYGRGTTDAHLKRFIQSLYGVELDSVARELCCLLLWLMGSAAGVSLSQVAKNIRQGNALTLDWWDEFELFEVLLMNPPWESLRHSVDDDLGGERAKTLARMNSLRSGAPGLPPLYSAQGTGDRNLFKGFVELVPHLLQARGRVGALLPAAFASDAGMTELRVRYLQQFEIARWTSFENRAGYFPIDSRYKFGLLAATRSDKGTMKLSVRSFATEPDEVDAPHIELGREDIKLIGRRYHIIPELVHEREREILRAALRRGTPLFEPGALGTVVYKREVDLSLHKHLFHHISSLKLRSLGDGTFVDSRGRLFVPLLEGRSVGAYDCFQKSWTSGTGRTAVWRENHGETLASCSPQYVISPAVELPTRIAICDVTASTNTRTVIATKVPATWRCGNTAPVLIFESEVAAFAGLGILNTMVFDWIARRMTSGLHLNKFILEGLVWPVLSQQEIEIVAKAAWSICRARPRSGLSLDEMKVPGWLHAKGARSTLANEIEAAATLEVLVAKGLGLGASQLQDVFSADKADRRGFWRYFDKNNFAQAVATRALKLF